MLLQEDEAFCLLREGSGSSLGPRMADCLHPKEHVAAALLLVSRALRFPEVVFKDVASISRGLFLSLDVYTFCHRLVTHS